jgi:hypothetical protein
MQQQPPAARFLFVHLMTTSVNKFHGTEIARMKGMLILHLDMYHQAAFLQRSDQLAPSIILCAPGCSVSQ